MVAVLENRTFYLTPVFENLHKPHNASAVLRTCDAMGIASAQFIESNTEYKYNTSISQGAHKWIDVNSFSSTQTCFKKLRKSGYIIIGTCLDESSLIPAEINLEKPMALVFGNEKNGLSDYAKHNCDHLVKIPMYGFVESFNISVAATIIMTQLMDRIKSSENIKWKLEPRQKNKLFKKWIFYNTRVGEIIQKKRLQKRIIEK